MKKFYRYKDIYEGENNNVRICEYTYDLLKETPCGYYINLEWWGLSKYNRKWVSKTARKRYAYPTKEQAMENFVARKRRQVAVLTAQLERAKVAWAEGCNRLSPINQGAKHLTKDAYDAWKKTPMREHGWTVQKP